MARLRRGEVRWYAFARPDENPSEVPLGPDDGMPEPCAVHLDHVPTVARGRLGALVTTLSTPRMAEIREALLFALDF